MTFFVDISGSMFDKSFFRSLTRHAHVETLKYTIELWIGGAESCVFRKNLFFKLNHINPIPHSKNKTSRRICSDSGIHLLRMNQYHLNTFKPVTNVTSPMVHKMITGRSTSISPAPSINIERMESASSVSGNACIIGIAQSGKLW